VRDGVDAVDLDCPERAGAIGGARDWSWIDTPAGLREVARRLAGHGAVALDTEGDSLHHYPARLSLVQLSVETGEAWLVDTLALSDLSPLAPIFADPSILTVVHAGDNDLAHLKRRHGLVFAGLFDTSIAARFLGGRALGLDTLIAQYLALELPPSRQKDNWSARPLSAEQERYAAADVQHLIALRGRLIEALDAAGRLAWVEEECEALAADLAPEPPPDPDAYAGLKGARDLSPRSLAALRELHAARERLARETGRPPFKILANETLVAVATLLPGNEADLAAAPGFTPRAIQRWGGVVLDAVARALALPDSELPALARPPRLQMDGASRRRVEILRQWRTLAAPRFGLDPGVLLPNRLIGEIALAAPRDAGDLARVDGLRRWRVEVLGGEILDELARPGRAARESRPA
jgi:ribonuclease D